jgi:predicted alpha/beta hydrolase family esterase
MNEMKILAIHGAWSSSTSFNYLKYKTKSKIWYCVDFDHRVDDWNSILQKTIESVREPYIALGHSLGGMIALHMSQDPNCRGIMTLASPLAGLDLNLIQLYLNRSSLISAIAKNSKQINEIQSLNYSHIPVHHLIANKGYNPFICEDNDGVLPIKVQTGWSCGEVSEIPANHYEILQSDATVSALTNFIKSCFRLS